MSYIKRQLWLSSLSVVLLLLFTHPQTTLYAQAEEKDEVTDPFVPENNSIWVSSAAGIQQIDPETGVRLTYDNRMPLLQSNHQIIDRENQMVYRIERLSDDPRPYIGSFRLLSINLITGEERTLFRGENPWSLTFNPSSEDHLILAYIPTSEELTRNYTPEHCILDLNNLTCTVLNEDAAINLFQFGPVHWLNEENFTDGNRIINAFTGEIERTVEGWVVWTFAPMRGTNDLFVVARPDDGKTPSDGDAGFYTMDLETFQLSEKLCDVPAFTRISIPQLSYDNRFVQYTWQNSTEDGNVVVNLETCQTVLETGEFGSLTWLPDGHDLIGQLINAENNPSNVVRINADTGRVDTLFEMDERVYFTVVD